jgi:hypothetical protein
VYLFCLENYEINNISRFLFDLTSYFYLHKYFFKILYSGLLVRS